VLDELEFPLKLPLEEIMLFLQIIVAERWPSRTAVVLC